LDVGRTGGSCKSNTGKKPPQERYESFLFDFSASKNIEQKKRVLVIF